MITKHGVKMDGGAINRLVQIFDEDSNNEITKKEVWFALDLYNCKTQNVTPTDSISPQLESVFKLIKIMKQKRIDANELYRMIDVDKNKVLELQELDEVIETFGTGDDLFTKKEIKSIHNFFDVNHDGKVEQLEFLAQIEDGTKKYEKYLQRISLKW